MLCNRVTVLCSTLVLVLTIECVAQISETPRPMRWDGTHGVAFFGTGVVRRANPPIRAYSGGGVRRSSDINIFRDFPNLEDASIDDVAAGPNDATVLAAVLNSGPHGIRHAILTYDASGKLVSVWDTAPYLPAALVVDDDASVYMLGSRVDIPKGSAPYPLLIHYSSQGKLLSEGLPSDSFKAGAEAIYNGDIGDGAVMMLHDRHFFIYAPAGREIVVCQMDGKVVSHLELKQLLTRIAQSDHMDSVEVRAIAFDGSRRAVLDLFETTTATKRTLASTRMLSLTTGAMKTLRENPQSSWALLGVRGSTVYYLHHDNNRQQSIDSQTLPTAE